MIKVPYINKYVFFFNFNKNDLLYKYNIKQEFLHK